MFILFALVIFLYPLFFILYLSNIHLIAGFLGRCTRGGEVYLEVKLRNKR